MDYTVLYVLLAVGIATGLVYLVSYLRKKDMVKIEDLRFAMTVLNIGMKVVSELRLDKEKEISKISEIVIMSLEYGITNFENESDVVDNAIEYAYELTEAMNIELTEDRKEIITDLIYLVFNNNYKDFIK